MASNQGGIEKKRGHVTLIELNASNQDMSILCPLLFSRGIENGGIEKARQFKKIIVRECCNSDRTSAISSKHS